MRATWLRGMLQVAVLSAVLMHMPQAMAALTVEIVKPDGDPFTAYVGRSAEFLAIAYLDGQELDSDLLSWNWNFGDGGTASLNPTAHAYSSAGNYYVTVTASYGGQQALAQAKTAHVVANTDNKTTYGVKVYYNQGPEPYRGPILARRTDGLKKWATQLGTGGYEFPCGSLPIGTYELCLDGVLQGQYADCGRTVTIEEVALGDIGWIGDGPYIIRSTDGKSSYSILQPSMNLTGTVRELIDMNPVLQDATILATGYSIQGCRSTSAADGTYSLTGVGTRDYRCQVVAQKTDHQQVGMGSNDNLYPREGILDFTLPIGIPTCEYGRLTGRITNYDEAFRIVIDELVSLEGYGQPNNEFSLLKMAGEQVSMAQIGPFYIGQNNKCDYALYLEPHGPVQYTVAALEDHQQDWTIAGPYGLVWGCAKASGVGRPNASVTFFTDDPYMFGGRGTDESGYYALRLIPGTYHRKVWDGSSERSLGDVTVYAGATQRVDFEW